MEQLQTILQVTNEILIQPSKDAAYELLTMFNTGEINFNDFVIGLNQVMTPEQVEAYLDQLEC